MKHASRIFLPLLSIVAMLLTACGGSGGGINPSATISISGAGVKGLLAGATIRLYQVDLAQPDLKGALLDEGSTGSDAAINGLTVEDTLSGLLLLEFVVDADTVEINTGKAPVFDRLVTVFDVQRIYDGDSIYASPLTTMAVSLAQIKADSSSPYIGNGDFIISEAEFVAALGFAQNQVKSTVGFGLDTTVDIFVVPPMINAETDTTAEQTAVVAYRQAIEALAAVTAKVAAESTTTGDSAQTILDALIEDLTDGDIDGQGSTGVVGTLLALDVPIETTMAAVDLSTLLIPGTTTPVTDVETELAAETVTTGETTDTTELEDGTIDVALEMPTLIVDSDGDGVDDSLDAFPSDATETIDTDSDGVGDNSDAFPNDATETTDTDSDGVGDNGDAFPSDPTETIDTDSDGVGDNGDAFPTDATETTDTDSDGVGDNGDAFPTDATETTDTDSDGVGDNADVFPTDSTETADTDSDTVGDNRDAFPTDPSLSTSFVQTTWVGETDTEQTFPNGVAGIEFYRSTDANCDITNYSLCTDGQMDILTNGQTVTDTALNINRNAYYTFKYGSSQTTVPLSTNSLPRMSTPPEAVEFNNKLWLITGDFAADNVLSSTDGQNWIKENATGLPSNRTHHTVAVFNNKLWIIAGYENAGAVDLNDVWSSSDGLTWVQETPAAAFSARSAHEVAVFNNRLWIIGGHDGTSALNDVWSSVDGINWVQETAAATFSARSNFGSAVFNNRLWVIAGGSPTFNDVWSSADGVNWVQETASAAFPARTHVAVTVFDNKMWLVAGDLLGSNNDDDVWSSIDGITWTQVTADADFTPRKVAALATFNNKLWLIGGYDDDVSPPYYFTEAWSSSDGASWTLESPWGGFTDRYGHQAVSYAGKLWVIGGYGARSAKNDVWSSTDGFTWNRETANAAFSARYLHKVAVFNNKLWLIGGQEQDGTIKNDIWSSTDGANWTQETAAAAFSSRSDFAVAVAFGRLWVIGGNDGSMLNDVWSSSDGTTWVQEIANAAFSARKSHAVALWNNRLWLAGGNDGSGKNDVWSSSDGVTWVQEISVAAFPTINFYESLTFNNKLWLLGANYTNDVWSSSDGVNWVEEIAEIPWNQGNFGAFTGRVGNRAVVFNNRMIQIGGHCTSLDHMNDVWSSTDGAIWRKAHRVEVQF